MIEFVILLILVLAAFRITRLVIEDDITEPLRERTTYKLDPRNKFRELLECPWCVGFWISLAVVLAYWQWPDPTTWVMLPFAISAGVGLIAETQ